MFKRGLIFTAAIVLTGCLASNPSATNQMSQAAIEAHVNNLRTLTASDLQPLADRGDQFAQYYLGNKYAQGKEVPQNMQLARQMWSLAGEQGNANALYNLGTMAYTGQGAERNYAEALTLFKRSADAGNPRAAFNVASMLERGQGAAINLQEAAHFYQLAGETSPKALYRLGLLFAQGGENLPADLQQATLYLQQAAAKGDASAPRALQLLQTTSAEQLPTVLKHLTSQAQL